jgi:hypothetical protein
MSKNLIFIMPLLFIFCSSEAQSKKDSLAIYGLLVRESATWRTGDVQGHADCWELRPYSRILISTGDGSMIDVPPAMMITPPSGSIGGGGRAIISNLKISIGGKKGWVCHDEESIGKDGQRTFSYEIRFLEKVKKEWKIIGQSIHVYKK